MLSWKTIDKLEAKVQGAPAMATNYRGYAEFDVRLGRNGSPLSLTGEDGERFRIENKTLDIAVEAPTLHEAKKLLREKLAASEDFTGTWTLWMHVDVTGGGYESERGGRESATCGIEVNYYVELLSGSGKTKRRRYMSLPGKLPAPFTGEFPVPKTHRELSDLSTGAVKDKHNVGYYLEHGDAIIEATPELVETIRLLQKRLGESGEQVKAALSRKRLLQTLEAVRSGGRLLGTSIMEGEGDGNSV